MTIEIEEQSTTWTVNSCKIINGIKYITTFYNYNINNTFLDEAIGFTLRDIKTNARDINIRNQANKYLNGDLVRIPAILYDTGFVEDIYFNFLNNISEEHFEFDELEDGEIIDMDNYVKFDDWINKYLQLKCLINIRYNKLKMWEEREIHRMER
jgi:hypothetical protein